MRSSGALLVLYDYLPNNTVTTVGNQVNQLIIRPTDVSF